jgi:hypothetical protein
MPVALYSVGVVLSDLGREQVDLVVRNRLFGNSERIAEVDPKSSCDNGD